MKSLPTVMLLVLLSAGALLGEEPEIDLTSKYTPIPKEENGFPLLQEAIKARVKPSKTTVVEGVQGQNTETEVFYRLVDWIQGSVPSVSRSERKFAMAHLRKNAKALALLEKALKKKRIQCPEIKSYSDPLPYLSPMRTLARLKVLKGTLLIEQGNVKEGFDEIASVLEFGDMIKASDSCLITYLVGKAIQDVGFDGWMRCLASSRIASAKLVRYATRLSKLTDDRPLLVGVLKNECKITKSGGPEFFLKTVFFEMGGTLVKPGWADCLLLPGLFDADRTNDLIDQFYRSLITQIYQDREIPLPRNREHPITILMSFNATGELLTEYGLAVLHRVGEKSRQVRAELGVLQVLLALKAYYQNHWRLPESLKTLVQKKYLTAIPTDPYGTGTLRYSKDRHILWTVGLDGENRGGTPTKEIRKRDRNTGPRRVFKTDKDPTFVIPFGQPKKAGSTVDDLGEF